MKKLMTLKGLSASLMLVGLMAGVSSSSHALTWRIDLHTDFGGAGIIGDTPWTTGLQGVSSVGGFYKNSLNALPNDPTPYFTPSNVTFGRATTDYDVTNGGIPPAGPDSFNTAADFNFSLYPDGNPGSAHVIAVTGTITGSVNDNQSNATWNLTGFDDTNSGTEVLNTATFLPNNPLAPAWQISTIVDGKPVMVWIETQRQIAANGLDNAITGYIADVPEPGTVAMVVGMGVSGGLVFRRRRKA